MTLFHFLRSLTQVDELCSDNLISFFKELDREKIYAPLDLVSFFKELDIEKNYALLDFIIMNKKPWLPRVSRPEGGKHLESRNLMPPAHGAQRHCHR